ncbi:succinyl-CoA synthetase beta subunit [Seinonella peptonophila]|uniref:Succinyl-CoA synthetase beta subunit n=1 Tax=Seinonella peptonophila TaxID=112248 RepID=A0A1M4SKJ5_9BACL|nr:ATP-grasp domain-containing protein [Seinonella peptonophila]SHE32721.1 succinyl-CoA synthetase beta subunit [Seinonella peptonophila]
MNLYEYEGKKLFSIYNIPISQGWLWPNLPSVDQPLMAKAQVLTGGRGKLGGILPVQSLENLEPVVQKLMDLKIKGEKTNTVYLEEIVSFQRELYLSLTLDRNEKSPILLVSKMGGVDIESVPNEQILQIPIHLLIGVQNYMIRHVADFLELSQEIVADLLEKLWRLFIREEAELVEINPLFVDQSGSITAGDAKVVLSKEDNKSLRSFYLPREENTFEAKCKQLGAVGVELDGEIAIITSGAGLGMATLDWICHHNHSVRALVDLGGYIIHDIQKAKRLLHEVVLLNPKGILINFYFQVASCEVLGQAIAEELGHSAIPVSVRLKGKQEEQALRLLTSYQNINTASDLEQAFANSIG